MMNDTDSYLSFDNSQIRISYVNNLRNRPTIIFLHDSYGCIELWRDFPEELCNITNCNKFIYDRQGYGKSSPFYKTERDLNYLEDEADILYKIINKLHIEFPIIFGHSDGGAIGLITAAKYPDYIKGLITEGAHTFVEEISYNGLNQALSDFKNTDLREKLKKYHGDKTDDVFWIWINTWASEKFKDWNIEYILPRINCPVLIIQGENDEYGSKKQVDSIKNGIKGKGKKLIVPNSGHTPHKTHKDIVLKETKSFIANLER